MKKSRKKFNVAVMGATGAVGQEILRILHQRHFPVKSLKLLASKRSVGKKLKFGSQKIKVEVLGHDSFKGIDLVLASAGGSLSREFAPSAVKAGAVVVDNTSAYRMDKKVPLVIPEINPEAIRKHRGIIANPNCSTIVMLVPLFPLHKSRRIKSISVATYQAASGAGAQAMEELRIQSEDVLKGKKPKKQAFPHQIAFNLFSHNSVINREGYNEEEVKMVRETHKILGRDDISIFVTCIRVPIFRAHSEAIHVEFAKRITPGETRKLLRRAPGVQLMDDSVRNYFPMPVDSANKDDIFVGRIRQDLNSSKSIGLFVSGDQIRKGAALNAVQIAEQL